MVPFTEMEEGQVVEAEPEIMSFHWGMRIWGCLQGIQFEGSGNCIYDCS